MSKSNNYWDGYGGYWGEHPDYPRVDWKWEVADDSTMQGYWEWCAFREAEDDIDEQILCAGLKGVIDV